MHIFIYHVGPTLPVKALQEKGYKNNIGKFATSKMKTVKNSYNDDHTHITRVLCFWALYFPKFGE